MNGALTSKAGHPVAWQAPRPLWSGLSGAAAPAILRFAGDDFMDQMLATLANDPARIGERLARPETWRSPPSETAEVDLVDRVPLPSLIAGARRKRALKVRGPTITPRPPAPLKLYQPAHQRFYLVGASLVCAIPGLPERTIAGGAETVGFVIRRLLPGAKAPDDTSPREFAYLKGGAQPTWRRVSAGADAASLAPGEDLLPLFPMAHQDEALRRRTLWSGLVPVGRREDYLSAAVNPTPQPLAEGQLAALHPASPSTAAPSITARMTQFKMEVAEPWKGLVRTVLLAQTRFAEQHPDSSETITDKRPRALDLNLGWQTQSWLILLDFADWLAAHLPAVWTAVGSGSAAGLTPKQVAVFNWLNTTTTSASMTQGLLNGGAELKPTAPSLREALKMVAQTAVRDGLEGAETLYSIATHGQPVWPAKHFPLAGLNFNLAADGAFKAVDGLGDPAARELDTQPAISNPADVAEKLDRLTTLVVRALDPRDESDAQPLPFALKLRDVILQTDGDPGWFVIRFVHINRDCGPLHPPTVSAPTERFQLASFFDPDAPVRPIRISLPLDTSAAGLRKHGRGTAFVISDMLCGQIQRAKGLGLVDLVRSVLPWPLHKDLDMGEGGPCKGGGLNIGMICSLSIPIITICALILLMIIVSLLDFIFRWMPWFVMCFPIPGLKGKK
ncbi:hypothetical protein BH10PSE4_BH10PSE4_21370 [soil metagenome]